MTPLILLFVAFLQAAQPPAAAAPAGNVEAGKRLYDKHTCYFRHGTAGQGGTPSVPENRANPYAPAPKYAACPRESWPA